MYENHETGSSGPQSPPPQENFSAGARPHFERKNATVAGVLSAMPGLGQVYVGYYQRGFIHIAVAAGVIFMLNQREFSDLQPLLGVFLAFFWIYNMIDAARCAGAVNRGVEAGLQPQLPELPAAIGGSGSMFTGVILVGAGLLFLGHTVMDFSLAWLADWWPLALILFGLRMIVSARHRNHSPLE